MNKKNEYPRVLIVGRTNVGKSTLFNRLAGKKKSIVFESDGVTRDYIQETITWADKTFNLVDTGGLCFNRKSSEIEKKIQEKVFALLSEADLLVYVCDIKNGLLQDDIHIAKILRKTTRPIVLVLNKADNRNIVEEGLHDFHSLGFNNIIPASAIHGTGIADLLNFMASNISTPTQVEAVDDAQKIIILGKPNVGKSSLMNLLTHQERSIVSPIAGTTREAISENINFCNVSIEIIDTAGVRRKSRVSDDLETLMVKNALGSIRETNVVLLMVDASAGKICDQELKLLFYALENKKPVIILYNKVDLLDEYTSARLEHNMEEYDFILKKTMQVSISCLTKKNVCKVLGQVQKVLSRCTQIFKSAEVDETIKEELLKKQLFHKRQRLKIFRVRNMKYTDIPTFVLHVNRPEWFGPSQLGFIENLLRKHYDLAGCPVQLYVQKV